MTQRSVSTRLFRTYLTISHAQIDAQQQHHIFDLFYVFLFIFYFHKFAYTRKLSSPLSATKSHTQLHAHANSERERGVCVCVCVSFMNSRFCRSRRTK